MRVALFDHLPVIHGLYITVNRYPTTDKIGDRFDIIITSYMILENVMSLLCTSKLGGDQETFGQNV